MHAAETAAAHGIDKLRILRSSVPAITHVDDSARVQTVHAARAPRFHAILSAFERRTGCPVLVNTSFNIRGEPIVHDPRDAYRCFMFTDIDTLVVGNCLLRKDRQPPMPGAEDYKRAFKPD
jgi:carbamoyltransferase